MGVQGFPNWAWTYGLLPLIPPLRVVVRAASDKTLTLATISGAPQTTILLVDSFMGIITSVCGVHVLSSRTGVANRLNRSEERRVGKECRYRWSRYQHRK